MSTRGAREFGLVGWPKTSGSRGMHICVRIERRWEFDEVRRAALALAREVETRAPKLATSKWWKEERHGVFVDYNQNAKDRTVASAYSVRPRPDARVSAPLAGTRSTRCDPADFTLATMPARFQQIGDRHAGDRCAGGLARADCSSSSSARARRCAVAAALQEAGVGASSRAAVQAQTSPPKHPLIEIGRAQHKEDALAGLERWKARHPRRRDASAAGRRAGRRDARALPHVDADPRQSAARARKRCARLRSRWIPDEKMLSSS